MEKTSIKNFDVIEPIYRDKPFWSWNGEINKKEIKRQVGIFKKMGFGGFFIHSRTGLKTEYMGKKWLNFVKYSTRISSKLGLQTYLYDEDRYPSGHAGGYATKDKRFWQKSVCVDICETYDPNRYERVVGVFNAVFDGEYLVTYSEYNAKSNGKVLVFYIEYSDSSPARNGFKQLDYLCREATENFIKETHEKYKSKCGKDFGKKIFGIFTDEVRFGCFFARSLTSETVNKNKVPYTEQLFYEFQNRYGYDVRERLPEIFFIEKGKNVRKIMWQFVELVQSLFLENFAKPYHEWCIENKLAFTGHVLQEETLSSQSVNCGSVMRFYEYMDFPGVDILEENGKNEWFVKQLTSVSKQLGKEFSATESYGATGYLMTFEKYKMIGDYQVAMGVNFRVPHLAWFTMVGRAKRDYPASFSSHSCWYKEYAFFEEYLARVNKYMSCGKSITDVCVIDPVESVWSMLRTDCIYEETYIAKSEDIIKVEKDFADTFYTITNNGIDFDYLNEDIAKKYAKVVKEESDTYISVGNSKYHTLIVSDCVIIRKETYDLINEFSKQGGKVIVNGKTLKFIDFNDVSEFEFKDVVFTNGRDELISELKKDKLLIEVCDKVIYNLKKAEDKYFLFACDLDRINEIGDREIIINAVMPVYEIDLLTNCAKEVKCRVENGKTIVNLCFDRGLSHLLVINDKMKTVSVNEELPMIQVDFPDEVDYVLLADNVMVLDSPLYAIGDDVCQEEYILTIDEKIREKFNLEKRREMSTQPWFKEKYWENYDNHLCDLTLSYVFEVEYIPEYLFFIAECIKNCKSVKVNGKRIKLKKFGFWIDSCFDRIKIPIELIKKGENTITVVYDFKESVDLEACYLTGKFGVSSDGKRIIKLPEKLKFGDITTQGLPSYSDEIIYKTPINSGEVMVDFGGVSGVTQCAIFGNTTEQVPFYPYKSSIRKLNGELAFKVDLSRNNTFGAIHNKDIYAKWNGPMNFLDVKDGNFSKDFVFAKQGLMIKPKVYRR